MVKIALPRSARARRATPRSKRAMRDQHPQRVLVLGDDMRIFLSVVRSLGRAGKEVHAAPFDAHSPALRSKYVSMVHHFPGYSDDPSGWQAALLHTLQTHAF